MSTIGLLRDARFHDHDTTPNHPERPARLDAIETLLDDSGLSAACVAIDARPVLEEELLRVHDPELLDLLIRTDAQIQANREPDQTARVFLDPDTVMSKHSWLAAQLAAGGIVDAGRRVADHDFDGAFCLPRPPGHHATPSQAMGFCLINHVAIAAADLLATGRAERVAIVDFDVHHGNGTQDIFYDEARVLYCSTHQFPHYPGTGLLEETGVGDAVGTTLNLPLPEGCGDVQYLQCFDEVILPAVQRFRPSVIFVSAGFDAHWRDPLASQQVSGAGYRGMAERIAASAQDLGAGVVYLLEGGYDLEGIAWAARHCLDVQLGNPAVDDPVGPAPQPGPEIESLLQRARQIHGLSELPEPRSAHG